MTKELTSLAKQVNLILYLRNYMGLCRDNICFKMGAPPAGKRNPVKLSSPCCIIFLLWQKQLCWKIMTSCFAKFRGSSTHDNMPHWIIMGNLGAGRGGVAKIEKKFVYLYPEWK